MHAVVHHTPRPDENPEVESSLSVGKSVTIHFGEHMTVWLRPSQAERLAADLTALCGELASA